MAFQHLKALLAPGAVLFGSTILGDQAKHTLFGKKVLDRFNAIGIFANQLDTEEDLRVSLSAAFAHSEVVVVGATAIFAASDDPSRDLTLPLGETATASSECADLESEKLVSQANRWADMLSDLPRVLEEARAADLSQYWRPLD